MGSTGAGRGMVSSTGNTPADKLDKIDERFMELTGFTLSEAINEVRKAINDIDDEYTVNYLKEQLPKLIDGTIKMQDVTEIADIVLR